MICTVAKFVVSSKEYQILLVMVNSEPLPPEDIMAVEESAQGTLGVNDFVLATFALEGGLFNHTLILKEKVPYSARVLMASNAANGKTFTITGDAKAATVITDLTAFELLNQFIRTK